MHKILSFLWQTFLGLFEFFTWFLSDLKFMKFLKAKSGYMYYLRLRKKFDPIAYCANIEMISALQNFPSKHNSVKLLLLISYIVFLGLCAYLLFYTENRDYGLLTREKKLIREFVPMSCDTRQDSAIKWQQLWSFKVQNFEKNVIFSVTD